VTNILFLQIHYKIVLCSVKRPVENSKGLFFFLLALQPIVGLYFTALERGYSLLAYEVS